MTYCLMALSHYLNQFWLTISQELWHSPENNFMVNGQVTILYNRHESFQFFNWFPFFLSPKTIFIIDQYAPKCSKWVFLFQNFPGYPPAKYFQFFFITIHSHAWYNELDNYTLELLRHLSGASELNIAVVPFRVPSWRVRRSCGQTLSSWRISWARCDGSTRCYALSLNRHSLQMNRQVSWIIWTFTCLLVRHQDITCTSMDLFLIGNSGKKIQCNYQWNEMHELAVQKIFFCIMFDYQLFYSGINGDLGHHCFKCWFAAPYMPKILLYLTENQRFVVESHVRMKVIVVKKYSQVPL